MYQAKEKIKQPAIWLQKHFGEGFHKIKEGRVQGYPLLQMKHFPGHEQHCSLTALSSVFLFHARHGADCLPNNRDYLFRRIRSLARWRGIYLPNVLCFKAGTNPFLLPVLAKAAWRYYGAQGKAKNHYFLESGRRAEDFAIAEIEARRPFLLSLHSGCYKRHTVTVYGYEVFERVAKNGTSERCVFLKVNDHWTADARYVALSYLDPLYSGPAFVITQVIPPLVKE